MPKINVEDIANESQGKDFSEFVDNFQTNIQNLGARNKYSSIEGDKEYVLDEDGYIIGDVWSEAIASLGHWGEHPQNFERDFHRWHDKLRKEHHITMDTYTAEIAGNTPSGRISLPFLLPHEMFSFLFRSEKAWSQCILGGGGEAQIFEYWQHVSQHGTWFAEHEASNCSDEELKCLVPWGLHGDDVATVKTSKSKVLVITTGSIFAHQLGSYFSRLPFAVVPMHLVTDPDSLQDIWKILVWSFRALRTGRWPSRNHLGYKLGDLRRGRN